MPDFTLEVEGKEIPYNAKEDSVALSPRVYLVRRDEDGAVFGIYSTEAKAKKVLQRNILKYNLSITPHIVDDPSWLYVN